MPLYHLLAKDKPNGLDHRIALRPEHLKYLENLGDRLVIAGPLQTEEPKATGSVVIIEAPDLATATQMFEQDPFVQQGVFESYEINRCAFTINKAAGH